MIAHREAACNQITQKRKESKQGRRAARIHIHIHKWSDVTLRVDVQTHAEQQSEEPLLFYKGLLGDIWAALAQELERVGWYPQGC